MKRYENSKSKSGGQFTQNGWKVIEGTNQLMIELKEPLGDTGSIEVDVTNFDPVTQNTDIKHNFITLMSYRDPNGDKPVMQQDVNAQTSIWIMTGNGYCLNGGCGVKYWGFPRGSSTVKEVEFITDRRWDKTKTYAWKLEWGNGVLNIYIDNSLIGTITDWNPMDKPLKYIYLGQNNYGKNGLIYNSAMPGPVFSNLRINGASSCMNLKQPNDCSDGNCDKSVDCNCPDGHGDCPQATCSSAVDKCSDGICEPSDCSCAGYGDCEQSDCKINDNLVCYNGNEYMKLADGANPAIAIDSKGNAHISYDCNCRSSANKRVTMCKNVCYIKYKKSDAVKGAVPEPVVVGSGWNSRISIDSDDNAHVVWDYPGNSGRDSIKYNRVVDGIVQWNDGKILFSNPGSVEKSRIAIDKNDKVYVYFQNIPYVSYVSFNAHEDVHQYSESEITNINTKVIDKGNRQGNLAIDSKNDVHFV